MFARKSLFLIISLLINAFEYDLHAQDTLVLVNGERVPFMRMVQFADAISIKEFEENGFVDYLPEQIFGYSNTLKERTYFRLFEPEGEQIGEYFFAQRMEVGEITLYEKKRGGYALYAEKDSTLFEVYNSQDDLEVRSENLEQFKSFLKDDDESMRYVSAASFKLKPGEVQKVIQYYNRRNYQEHLPSESDVIGRVYLYRTQFQKTEERIRIKLYGVLHDLYMEDFVQLDLPVIHAAKLTLFDGSVRNEIMLSGELRDQYFEVLYDSRNDAFRLDSKDGTELSFEFFKIRDKVNKRVGKD